MCMGMCISDSVGQQLGFCLCLVSKTGLKCKRMRPFVINNARQLLEPQHMIFLCLLANIISYHVISYHISYHVISYIISYHIISYIISYHIISYIISYRIVSYHIISYHIISYHIISYHIISYHIISYLILSYHIINKGEFESSVSDRLNLQEIICSIHGVGERVTARSGNDPLYNIPVS